MKTFRSLVRHNLERFNPARFDYLVTACATCTSTIREVWPMMAAAPEDADLRSQITQLARKTVDINAFLVSQIGVRPAEGTPGDDAVAITYHDPCHLKKALGVASEPRTLIRANSRYRLKEMLASDWCCGMGGSFNLQYYDISSNIGKKKRDNIMATGCSVVATGCPACMLQISDMLSDPEDRIAVRHPIEIYAESLKR